MSNLPRSEPPSISTEPLNVPVFKGKRFALRLPHFSLAFSERRLMLFVGDVTLLNLSLLVALGFVPVFALPFSLTTITEHSQWFVSLSLLWWMMGAITDAYDLKRAADRLHGPLSASRTVILTSVLYFLLPYLSAPLTNTRLSWALFTGLALISITLWRLSYAVVFAQPVFRHPLLIVGAGWAGRTLAQAVHEGYQQTYRIVGFVDDDPNKSNQMVDAFAVLGGRDDLRRLVRAHQVREIVVAITQSQHITGELFQILMDCEAMGVQVTSMIDVYERLTGRVPVEHIGNQVFVLLPLGHVNAQPIYRMARRLVDVVVALLGLMFFALLLPLLALLIRLDSPGPIFYWQKRVGLGGKEFWVVKLRTMVVDAEQDGQALWAMKDDPRATRFGRFARRLRIDEVPQLWNVLKGEMSLIGPRPERREFEVDLEQQIPFYRSRHMIKPGLTGWAQVNYGYGASVQDALIKLQYDLYYIKHQSLWLDLLILYKTAGVIFRFTGT
jgi:exopolysaccharide biosynthesis polyprenyl glycosylphosphotransferase